MGQKDIVYSAVHRRRTPVYSAERRLKAILIVKTKGRVYEPIYDDGDTSERPDSLP